MLQIYNKHHFFVALVAFMLRHGLISIRPSQMISSEFVVD